MTATVSHLLYCIKSATMACFFKFSMLLLILHYIDPFFFNYIFGCIKITNFITVDIFNWKFCLFMTLFQFRIKKGYFGQFVSRLFRRDFFDFFGANTLRPMCGIYSATSRRLRNSQPAGWGTVTPIYIYIFLTFFPLLGSQHLAPVTRCCYISRVVNNILDTKSIHKVVGGVVVVKIGVDC